MLLSHHQYGVAIHTHTHTSNQLLKRKILLPFRFVFVFQKIEKMRTQEIDYNKTPHIILKL